MSIHRAFLALMCFLVLAFRTSASHADPLVLGPVVSAQYSQAFPVHGVGGDERLIFALQPSDVPGHARGIWASHRVTGQDLGAVTPPPMGWGAALAMKVVSYRNIDGYGSQGHFVVLDGFAPAQAGTRPGIVYEYDYHYTACSGLSTTLTGTHPLPMFVGFDGSGLPLGPLYPISLARLPSGAFVVIDFLLGSIWVSDANLENWALAMIDPRFEAGELTSPLTGIGYASGDRGTVPYTFSTVSVPPFFPFSILPGIHGVAYCNPTDEVAVLRTATPGGIYGIPASVLTNTAIPADAKGASVREIAAPAPGVTDLAVGLDYDRWNPTTRWLYWQRVIATSNGTQNPVYRVDLFSGKIELLAQSTSVYFWTNEISVLPSLFGRFFTDMTNANMQEPNDADSNALLNGVSTLVGPTIVPVAAFSNW